MLIWISAYLLLGLVSGFFAGLLGIGGGAIMVPVLTSLFILQDIGGQYTVHMALATSLSAIIITSFSSLKAHHAHQAIIWSVVKKISPAILLGTFLSAYLARLIPAPALALFFVVFMSLVAVQILIDKRPKPARQIPNSFGLSLFGLITGAISALLAIGGGSLTVPFLFWCNIDIKKAIATSSAIGLPIAIAGTAGYISSGFAVDTSASFTLGYVYWPAMLCISITAYFAAPVGAALAHRLPIKTVKRVFALLIVVLAIRMLLTQI